MKNKQYAQLMTILLAGILAVLLAGTLRVSNYAYREVRGVWVGTEYRKWIWE